MYIYFHCVQIKHLNKPNRYEKKTQDHNQKLHNKSVNI